MPRLLARRVLATLLAAVSVMFTLAANEPNGHDWAGPWFGDENWDPRCEPEIFDEDYERIDVWLNSPDDAVCHHMRTSLNDLDSPQVDVLIMVPASPTAERDMRLMRQSVEMWEAGIDYVARKQGLTWLADGMDFHISVSSFDPSGNNGEFTTYPIVDPEIVVIASNPVGGIGIGIDPLDFVGREGPCHGIPNGADFEFWENVPGFDSHHDERSGTYTEDCGGSGGNICLAVNGAIDPTPGGEIDIFGLFDLVSHEFGHCLTIGHVGDGAEGDWGAVPTNDIMAYSDDPVGRTKCVSSLDVEAVAAHMSKYLDVNGDGVLQPDVEFHKGGDLLLVNDQTGDLRNAFQVQHPDDHFYASITGEPELCPQPDTGLTPGPRTQWDPEAEGGDQG